MSRRSGESSGSCAGRYGRLIGEEYHVHTTRGLIKARYVVNATESYTPLLHPQFHDRILPTQTQAASGDGGPATMQPHVGVGFSASTANV